MAVGSKPGPIKTAHQTLAGLTYPIINMLIFRHHTCSDVIELDEATGYWRPIADDDRPSVGALGVAHLDGYDLCGSYTIEGGRRYCMYWAKDHRFALMLPSAEVIYICKHEEGRIEMLTPGIRCEIEDSRSADGQMRQGFSRVRVLDKNRALAQAYGPAQKTCVPLYFSRVAT